MWLSKLKELKLALRAGRVTLPYPFVRSAPTAGFRGRPVLDGTKCLGCGACAQVCPPRTISVIDNQDTRTILVDYARCTYCARCEEVCRVGSITLNHEFELATTDKNDFKLSAVLMMAKCSKCGTPFMTKRMLAKLVDEFSPAWLQTKEETPEWFSTCPACRKKKECGNLKGGVKIV
ncbi:4Fe-4S binding protein [Dehalobacter sp. DCM]|uniref:4Fe-4S binding protein n=1 Tax=Dehalobacter sp. DCM TaxID=2907827 RepID=UPI0030812CA9|nr:4Fe-4S binding protein [Dehalobacter sp. DCM]